MIMLLSVREGISPMVHADLVGQLDGCIGELIRPSRKRDLLPLKLNILSRQMGDRCRPLVLFVFVVILPRADEYLAERWIVG